MNKQENNLNYLKDFGARNFDMILMGHGVDVFNILTVRVSPFFAIVFTTGTFVQPPAVPSGKRHMTHFTEAALLGVRPGEDPRFLVGAKTFCSSSDEFDLVTGEKVALTRLLERIKKDNPGVTNHTQRATAWARYFAARDAQDERLFNDIMAQAKAQALEEAAQADAERWKRNMEAAQDQQASQQRILDYQMAQQQAQYQQGYGANSFFQRTRPQLVQNWDSIR